MNRPKGPRPPVMNALGGSYGASPFVPYVRLWGGGRYLRRATPHRTPEAAKAAAAACANDVNAAIATVLAKHGFTEA